MTTKANIYQTAVLEDSSVILLARIIGANGNAMKQIDVTDIERQIFDLHAADPSVSLETTAPVVASTIENSLQNTAIWTVDNIGYNFIDAVDFNTLDVTGGNIIRVEYKINPATGFDFFVVFELQMENILSS